MMPFTYLACRASLMCCVVALMGGCSIYLHDEALQKQTGSAVQAYKAADVPGSIKAAIAAQAAFDQRILDSVVAEDAALRDLEIADLLHQGRATDLQTKITSRFADLGGPAFVFQANEWQNRLGARQLAYMALEQQEVLAASAARRYREAGGKQFKSCDDPIPDEAADASPQLQVVHRQLVASCHTRNTRRDALDTAVNNLQKRACGTDAGSLLFENCEALKEANAAIHDDLEAAKTAKAEFEKASAKLDAARNSPTIDQRVTDALGTLAKDLKHADQIAGDLGAANFKPSAALAGIKFRKTNICDVLAASAQASCSGGSPTQAATDGNKAVVGVIAGFAKVLGTPPDTEALSMALAYQTGRQSTVQIALDGMRSRQALLESEQNAYVSDVEYLLKARESLTEAQGSLGTKKCSTVDGLHGLADVMKLKDCGAVKPLARSLSAYSLSWADGRTAARIAYTRETQQITMTNLRIAQANATARDAVLSTALAELDAFGQGGVSPETIAEFLQAIGVAAVAKGVN